MLMLLVVVLAQAPEKVAGATFEKTNKPSGLMPEHLRVAAPGFGKLDLVTISDWEKLFAVEPKTKAACVTAPVAALKKALKSKALPPVDKELAMPGCLDSSAPFTVQARRVRLGKVEGFLFVTEQLIEDVLISNGGLQAWFVGLSDDGKTYVVGSTNVKAKGLRDDGGDLQRDPAAYKKAIAQDTAMLAKLNGSDFEPSLDVLATELAKVTLP